MSIQMTSVQQLSETRSQVTLVIADSADADAATFRCDLACTVDHPANPLVAELQIEALRRLRDELSETIRPLTALANQRS